jgi:hypothetical protein
VTRRCRRARLAVVILAAAAIPACSSGISTRASCTAFDGTIFTLAAQSVPSATLLPCVAKFPAGWSYDGSDVRSGRSSFWLDDDRAGARAVEVDLTRSCDVGTAVEVTPAADEAGTRRFEDPITLRPAYQANRYYTFPGGCVTYRFRFQAGASTTLALEVDEALSFRPRAALVAKVRDEFGETLCGADAPPCAG